MSGSSDARQPSVLGLTCETDFAEDVPLSPNRLSPVVLPTPVSLGSQPNVEHFQSRQKSPLFMDAESIKRSVRESLHRPSYSVEDFYHERGLFQHIAKSNAFGQLTFFMIILNSLWIALDTDLNPSEVIFNAPPIFQVIEFIFFSFFIIEWLVRFMAFRHKCDARKDSAFVFDSVLVLAMLVDTLVMGIITVLTGTSTRFDPSVLRLARLLRLARVSRLARLLRDMPELMILLKGMLAATRSVLLTLGLVLIVVYIFAIGFRQLTAGTQMGATYFETVPLSMRTLLVYGTFLDDVGTLIRDVGRESTIAAGAILLYILLATITLMNMLIGVLCVVVTSVAVREREEMAMSFVKNKMLSVLHASDEERSVSKDDLMRILEHGDAVKALHEVGVDPQSLIDFADLIFQEADPSKECHDKKLTFGEFIQILMDMRGSNVASVKDLMNLKKTMQKMIDENDRQLRRRFAKFDINLRAIMDFHGVTQKTKNSSFQPSADGKSFEGSQGSQSIDSGYTFTGLKPQSFQSQSSEGHSVSKDIEAFAPSGFAFSSRADVLQRRITAESCLLHAKIDQLASEISIAFQRVQKTAQELPRSYTPGMPDGNGTLSFSGGLREDGPNTSAEVSEAPSHSCSRKAAANGPFRKRATSGSGDISGIFPALSL
eukprot:TRINITY_DN35625_c0_g1_i1.p1 TRINITY_DN35625_c0_g1~~TRINITY_DN35625_c0_g1_i1.p1  ORF type:complete len:658 (+),score=109.51 TRINITY_DN35625_c0_g1_i1:59-2032(+)